MCGEACQICFESAEGFRLSQCDDYFCVECFCKYVDVVLLATRGFARANIACPSCRQPIREEDWVPHVQASTVKRYRALSEPYRPFMRFCLNCGKGNAALAITGSELEPKFHFEKGQIGGDEDAGLNWQKYQLLHIKQFPLAN
ncbi:hypothetical protein L0F63_002087, partial [Massospora cicadina]